MSGGRDDVRVGLIGGTGIICGAAMGAVITIALMRRDERSKTAPARPAPTSSSPSAPPGPGKTPTPPPANDVPPGSVGRDADGAFYVVERGDYGAKIAARLGYPGDVQSLVDANPDLRGRWKYVEPGDRLRLPQSWTTRPAGQP